MKKGYNTTEFWLVLAVVAFAVLSASGVLSPERITKVTDNITKTQEALPALIDAISRLFDSNGSLAIAAAAVWAYLKRRHAEKLRAAQATIADIRARADVRMAESRRLRVLGQEKLRAQREIIVARAKGGG